MKLGAIFRLPKRKKGEQPTNCGACQAWVNPDLLVAHNYTLLCPTCFAKAGPQLEYGNRADEYSDSGELLSRTGLTSSQMGHLKKSAEFAGSWLNELLSSLPFLFYVVLYFWSEVSELGKHVFTGYLIADVATWIIRVFVCNTHRPVVLVLHVIGYIVVVGLWIAASGALSLPDDAGDRGIVMLVGMGVFGGKMFTLTMQRLHGTAE